MRVPHRFHIVILAVAAVACRPAPLPWTIRPDGAGPIRFGTPQADVARGLGMPAEAAPTVGGCWSWRPAGTPIGLRLMVVDGRVVRADVDSGPVRTREGAHVGSTEAQVGGMYPGLITQPHKYRSDEGWHYLIAQSSADSTFRFVFETDGKVVKTYRAGIEPFVEYVEGCG